MVLKYCSCITKLHIAGGIVHQNRKKKKKNCVYCVQCENINFSGEAISYTCTSLHDWSSLCEMADKLTKFIRWQSEGKKMTKTANTAVDSEVSFR